MPQQANLIHETSDTTGTGNFTLTAVAQRFSAAFGTGAGNTFDYFIVNREAVEWERGIGYMSDANTLVRDTVIESSNSNAAVNFSAGTKDVANDVPAAEQLRSTSNLSDIDDASTARGNLGLAIGTNVQAHDADLDALAALSGTGLLARTAANTYAERTIQGGDGIDLTNGNGVSGNPSVATDSTVPRGTPTKGNVAVGNGTAWAMLGVGSDDQVLTADSAQATGVKWADASGGGGINRGTVQATTSGTAVDFTSIPAGVNRITVILDQVSADGTDDILVQIGGSGGIETTGYTSQSSVRSNSSTSTSGFLIRAAAIREFMGLMTLCRITGNVWVETHILGDVAGANAVAAVGGGRKSLSTELDRVRITTSGTDVFDNGQINIFWE